MFKKILLSLLIIFTASTTTTMGTHALVSDSATLGVSTYSTGSVDLKISSTGEDGSFQDSIDGFSNVTLYPGDSVTHRIYLKNESSTGALKLSGQAFIEQVEGELENIDPTKVSIKFIKVDSGDPPIATSNSGLTTWAGDTPKSFGTTENFALPADTTQAYDMVISLSSTAPDGAFSFSFIFSGDYTTLE